MQLPIYKYSNYLVEYLDKFETIDLDEMNQAKLMNRMDHKFLFTMKQLEQLLPKLSSNYQLLEINKQLIHPYTSFYFDTPDFDMYRNHHNRRVNRYKIRQRFYHTTNDSFLEIKFKSNKGETIKKRIETAGELKAIPLRFDAFVSQNSIYKPIMLKRVLENGFNRITLTNKKRNQRITIDTGLAYWYKNKPSNYRNLVIAEVKSTKGDLDQSVFRLMKEQHIHPTGMSKYSMGIAMLDPKVKSNLFKQKINLINKLNHA